MSAPTGEWHQVTAGDLSRETLERLVAAYPLLIQAISEERDAKPSKFDETLASLDAFRYDELPTLVAKRLEQKDGHVDKEELERLLGWKMTRGSFRPVLRTLIASNASEHIQAITRQAYLKIEDAHGNPGDYVKILKKTMKTLCLLQGVGPAMASLILSIAFPTNIPFFADELYAWTSSSTQEDLEDLLEQVHPSSEWGKRVDKVAGIKYTEVEYINTLEVVKGVQERLSTANNEISATDIEKAAYVVVQARRLESLKDLHPRQPSSQAKQIIVKQDSQSTANKERKTLEKGDWHPETKVAPHSPKRSARLASKVDKPSYKTARKRRKQDETVGSEPS